VRPSLEVADIFRHHGARYRAAQGDRLSRSQRRVMAAIEACRTATLGGHAEVCADCGIPRIAYNSCRNRHCPKCQGLAQAQWVADRQADLLPVPYFHLVFTVPPVVAEWALGNKEVIYGILFRAAAQTLQTIAADPRHLGAEIGLIAVLHTWGQNLHHHPHVHCIVPGGGPAPDGQRWVACRPGFFLPVHVLSKWYRRRFLEALKDAYRTGGLVGVGDPGAFARHLDALSRIDWVVYAKPPFGGPTTVLEYLGRYTHRVAMANSRLIEDRDGSIRFRWKDYRHHGRSKVMTLTADEFIRRFLLHTLPDGFHRIRHYGFLANGQRCAKLALCRQLLEANAPAPIEPVKDYRERYHQLTGHALDRCPLCGGPMILLGPVPPQRPVPQPPWNDTS
jgi:hypothetical protein